MSVMKFASSLFSRCLRKSHVKLEFLDASLKFWTWREAGIWLGNGSIDGANKQVNTSSRSVELYFAGVGENVRSDVFNHASKTLSRYNKIIRV